MMGSTSIPEPSNRVEYAGFLYTIIEGRAYAEPGQHRAATKQRHLWAAVEIYKEQQNER